MTANQCFGRWLWLVAVVAAECLACGLARAETHYVSLTGGHQGSFSSWSTAATNLNSAINASINGDVIIVSNGVYWTGATISINKCVTISSLYGPAQTIFNGNGGIFAGFTISSSAVTTTISGLTITNFYGGGIYVSPGTLTLNNCIVSGNSNSAIGGGISAAGAGTLSVSNCIISDNTVPEGAAGRAGAGIYSSISTCWVDRCYVMRNFGGHASGGQAGIHAQGLIFIRNSTISDNGHFSNYQGGGGVALHMAGSRIANSIITGNQGANNGGGILMNGAMIVENCLIAYNVGWTGGGVMNDAGIVRNCTIVHNSGQNWSGGVGAHAASYGTNINCIVYSNFYDNYTAGLSGYFTNSCTTPLPAGPGNISVNPQLVNHADRVFLLNKTSPCRNTGANQPWMNNAFDLDGGMRIQEDVVDMGAYEWVPNGTVFIAY